MANIVVVDEHSMRVVVVVPRRHHGTMHDRILDEKQDQQPQSSRSAWPCCWIRLSNREASMSVDDGTFRQNILDSLFLPPYTSRKLTGAPVSISAMLICLKEDSENE
jgi:hypothetical protein